MANIRRRNHVLGQVSNHLNVTLQHLAQAPNLAEAGGLDLIIIDRMAVPRS